MKRTLSPQQIKVRSAVQSAGYSVANDSDPTDPGGRHLVCNPDPGDSCRIRLNCNSDPEDRCY